MENNVNTNKKYIIWKYRRVVEHAPKQYDRVEDAMQEMQKLTEEKRAKNEDWVFTVVQIEGGKR